MHQSSRRRKMKDLTLLTLLLLISCSLTFAFAQQAAPAIVLKAAESVNKKPNDKIDTLELFEIAKLWQQTNNDDAWELYEYLADQHHVPSMARLGHHYPENDERALKYFVRAGEEGPHHASLYNAGRIFAQQQDWVQALYYLKVAAALESTHPEYAQESTTVVSKEAHATVSQQVPNDITLVQMADIFMFGSIHDLPENVETLWREAITSLVRYSETQDDSAKQQAANALQKILSSHRADLTSLQIRMATNALDAIVGDESEL